MVRISLSLSSFYLSLSLIGTLSLISSSAAVNFVSFYFLACAWMFTGITKQTKRWSRCAIDDRRLHPSHREGSRTWQARMDNHSTNSLNESIRQKWSNFMSKRILIMNTLITHTISRSSNADLSLSKANEHQQLSKIAVDTGIAVSLRSFEMASSLMLLFSSFSWFSVCAKWITNTHHDGDEFAL